MDQVYEKILGFMLVVSRVSAFFLVMPVFSWKSIPLRVKIPMMVLLSFFFSMLTALPAEAKGATLLEAGLMISNEALYGLAFGLMAVFLFSAVKLGGRIIGRQMGLARAKIMDPLTGQKSQPLSSLLEIIFIIMFLSADGHHLLLMMISRSYNAFPLGGTPDISGLTNGVVASGAIMFKAALRLAAPMLAVFLMLMVVLAVVARMVPQMNILFISLPLRVGLGLMMATVFLPLISKFVSEFADWMGKLIPL